MNHNEAVVDRLQPDFLLFWVARAQLSTLSSATNMKFLIITLALLFSVPSVADNYRYLISFHKPDAVLIVDEAGQILWKAQNAPDHPQECSVIASGDILCSEYAGVVAIGLEQQEKWRFTNPPMTENPVAFEIGEDRYLIAVEGPTQLREISSSGKIHKEIQLSTSYQPTHGQIRGARKTQAGTYLVSFYKEGALREYNDKGEVIRNFGEIPRTLGAIRLPNGNTLINNGFSIQELDNEGKLVWEFNTRKDAQINARPYDVAKLRNGNVVMRFYSKNPTIPTLMEVSHAKKVIRKITVPGYTNVGGFKVLDKNFKHSANVVAQ